MFTVVCGSTTRMKPLKCPITTVLSGKHDFSRDYHKVEHQHFLYYNFFVQVLVVAL